MSGNWNGTARRDRLPRDWHAIRRRILTRDGHHCTWVEDGRRCSATATDVDHIERGDDHRDANLRALCGRHHRVKTAAEGNAAKAGLRKAAKRPAEPHPGRRRSA
jgi:5-methylcytosine-specific restriction enzyme A